MDRRKNSDIQQSIYDPFLLFSPTNMIAVLLCNDDTLVAIHESLLPSEAAIENRFECREHQFLPSDFKGLDVIQESSDIVSSQMGYLETKGNSITPKKPTAKLDHHRELLHEKLTKQCTADGRLAWLGTGTSPTSSCIANMALQGTTKTVALLQSCCAAYQNVAIDKLASLGYAPLEFDTIHIRVFTDGSLENLPDKLSQIGFLFVLIDGDNRCTIFHWHTSRATRRQSSTEEAELFSLHLALQRFRKQCQIMFQLLHK